MFSQSQSVGEGWPSRALVFSVTIHCALIMYLSHQPQPIIVTLSTVMAGENGSALGIVYLPTDASVRIPVNEQSHSLRYEAPHKKRAIRQPRKSAPVREEEHATEARVQSPPAGSTFGSLDFGPSDGHDVRPALPVTFPDPRVPRSELPEGFVGDIVIEVTIDATGNIIEKRVLQSVGRDIDQKVLAVLAGWRFRPATRDGLPIPSRQDVHFHFPS
jgi:TonB family C-terminal domain